MELAAAQIVPGNTLTAVISVPWQQQLQHDLRPWWEVIGTSAWDSSSSSKPRKEYGRTPFARQCGWVFTSTMNPSWPQYHMSTWLLYPVQGVMHSPFHVFFSLPHLDLRFGVFLGRCTWRGTSWSTGGGNTSGDICDTPGHWDESCLIAVPLNKWVLSHHVP